MASEAPLKKRKTMTRICCMGAGYVGGPTMAMHVDVIDK
jgi:hypothetical protein